MGRYGEDRREQAHEVWRGYSYTAWSSTTRRMRGASEREKREGKEREGKEREWEEREGGKRERGRRPVKAMSHWRS
jgi:hypothetical protein